MNFEDYSPKVLAAAEETVLAYDKAIWLLKAGAKNDKKVRRKWKCYSTFSACRLCAACGITPNETPWEDLCSLCKKCPLGPSNRGCAEKTNYRLFLDIGNNEPHADLLRAFRDRRKWILAKMKENDVVFEEVK